MQVATLAHMAEVGASQAQGLAAAGDNSAYGTGEAFGKVLEQFVSDVNVQQLKADHAVEQLVTGEARSVSEVMLAMGQAELTFRLMMEVRNRAVEAYQEIMRMPL